MIKMVWISVLLLGAATFATADVFTNSALWEAAATGITTINFGVLSPPAGGDVPIATPSGVTLSGVNFSSTGSAIFATSDTFCCSTYTRGGDTLNSGVANNIVVTLPTNTTAIGFDFFTVTNGDYVGAFPENVDIDVNGTKYVVGAAAAPGLVFFGLTSASPITSLTITPEQAPTGTAADLTDFSYGGSTVVTPEPGYYWPAFGLGAFLLASRLRAFRRTSQQ
jgi:hypothetical protein